MTSFDKQLAEILDDYSDEIEDVIIDCIRETTEIYIKNLKIYSLEKGWKKYSKGFQKKEYSGKSKINKSFHITNYVGNITLTSDGLPLVNILENGAIRKNRGIMQPQEHLIPVLDKITPQLINLINNKIEKIK